jgi:hypothetical protein
MPLIFIALFFISTSVNAWTLISAGMKGFQATEVTINFANTSCSNAGLTSDTLQSNTKEAIDIFWNKVSGGSLTLKMGGLTSINIDGQTSSAAVAANLAADNTILVGCNDDVSSFSNGFTGAVGSIACNSAGVCRGAVIVNAHSSSTLPTYSANELQTLLGHEIGHAIGLGHSSVEEAIMYYSLGGKTQEYLHQDDINGFTYLYPNKKKLGGLAGSCSSITNIDKPGGGLNSFLLLALLGFLLSKIAHLSLKLKRRLSLS